MLATLFLTSMIALQAPAPVEYRYRSNDRVTAAKKGCKIQYLPSTPGRDAGPALIRCALRDAVRLQGQKARTPG